VYGSTNEDIKADSKQVISALLGHLDSKLLEMLNVPLDQSTEVSCDLIMSTTT
jgi:hypothetical protein